LIVVGDKLIGGIISLVIAGAIGFFALDFFSGFFAVSLAVGSGKRFHLIQQGVLRSVVNNIYLFIGGGTLLIGIFVKLYSDS
jgi:uncharacterized membrane protein